MGSNPNESTNKTQSYSSFNHPDAIGDALNQPGLELTEEERQRLTDTLKYIWGTLIGDWNNESDPLQSMYNMGAGLIPVVDQVLDVRDLTAHLYYMIFQKDYKSPMRWVSLVLTAIGAIPTIGSVVKGIGKLTIFHGGAKAAAKYSEPFLDSLKKINPEWADIGTLKAQINANWDDGVAGFKDLWFSTLTNVKGTVDSIPAPPWIKKFSEFKEQIQKSISEIQGLSTSKLDESFGLIRRQIDEFLDAIILGQKRQLSADGVGNVSPSHMEIDGVGRNQPMRMEGNQGAGISSQLQNKLNQRLQPNIRNNLLNNSEAVKIVGLYGDDALELIARYGDNAINALPKLAEILPSDRLGSLLQKINSGQISGDLSETLGRVADGGTNTIGAVGELNGFLRAIERGYDKVESIKPPDSIRIQGKKGEKSPEASLFKGSQEFRLEQKTATEPPVYPTWKKHFDKANKQVKKGGFAGDIQFDFTNVDISKGELNSQIQIEAFIKDRMRPDRARNINYFEILWKDTDGKIMKTYRTRNADGTVSEIITEKF